MKATVLQGRKTAWPFFAITDIFLSEHLGGRYQPVGDDFKGSSVTVPAGADQIKTLPEALKEEKK